MTAMRSESDIASPWSCVTYMNVMPTWSWMRSSSSSMCWRSLRSSAASGSSSSSTCGRSTSARAMATRCFCPPESWLGYFHAWSDMRIISRMASTDSSISAFGFFARRSENAMLSQIVIVGNNA